MESIHIKFMTDEGVLINRHIVRSFNGKFTFTVEKDGNYKICSQNILSTWMANKEMFIKLKIESDTTEELNISQAVKTEDINPVSDKINKIIRKAQKIVNKQIVERQKEDTSYQMQQDYSNTFISITLIQIVIVLLIGIYHIYTFRKFLVNNNLI